MSYYLHGFQFSCRDHVPLPHKRHEGTPLHCLDFWHSTKRLPATRAPVTAHYLNAIKDMVCTGTSQQAPSSASVFKTDILFRKTTQAQRLPVMPSIPSNHPGIENCYRNGKQHIDPHVSQNCQTKLSFLCCSFWFCLWHNLVWFSLVSQRLSCLY